MAYVIETLDKKPVWWIKILLPSDGDDAIRLLMSLYEKKRHLKDNQSLHIVLDLSTISFSEKFPVSQFMSVLSQVYDKWHLKTDLKLWIVVELSLLPVLRSLTRTIKLPVHVYTEYREVIEAIERLLGATEQFYEDDTWSFLNP